MSAFWTRKMKTYFNVIDFDKDGSITKADFEGMGARFVDTGAGDAMKAKLVEIWEKYISAVGGGAAAISKADFIKAMGQLVKDQASRDTLAGPLPLFFQAIDANKNGSIDESEFGIFFKILGLDPEFAPASFKAIDTNNDGSLSSEEFVTGGIDFFVSEDENSPSQLFWGPLLPE